MKKLILCFTFIFSQAAFSEGLYLYYESKDLETIKATIIALDQNATIKEVYSPVEKRLLQGSNVHSHILKIKTEVSKEKISKIVPALKLETIQQIEFQSLDYSERQWHLANKGGDIYRWTSDIDRIRIQAMAGEDIQVQAIEETSNLIKVAVIDSGIDLNHPDLKNQIQSNPLECEALAAYKNCLDTTSDRNACHSEYANKDHNGNGYPLDCHGWSFTNKSFPGVTIEGNPEITDMNGHGTHVSGIIAAEKNNFGVTGIIQNAKIIPIQVSMSSAGDNAIDKMAKGVLYAIKSGAQVINLSLGWRTQFDSKLMREMIALAISQDILVVVAGGNNSHSDISYPCAYPDTICVASHDETGNLSSFSNRGSSIDIIAPGSMILSTWPTTIRSKRFTPDDDYEYMSGTSQAAPIVTGAIAKMLNQGVKPKDIRLKLLLGARKKKQTNNEIRFGNLDIKKALQTPVTSMIFPINKTPYLIKWDQSTQQRFKLRLKNYGVFGKNINVKVTALSDHQHVINGTFSINELSQNQDFEKDIYFNDSSQIESELKFNIEISSHNQSHQYILKAHYIRLIDDKALDTDIIHFNVLAEIEKSAIIRPFSNITHPKGIDFFVSHRKGNKQFISILKATEEGYIRSRPLPMRDKNPVFLNFSKVDLEGDGLADYVIMYVIIDNQKNKLTKFMLFDHELKPKRYLISPKNEFANEKTFIPGKFKWLKQNKKMLPAWVSFGEAAEQHFFSPWEIASPSTGNHFYYLTEEGLKNFKLPQGEILLNTLYQSLDQLKSGEVEFITTSEIGFEKTYQHYLFNEKLELISEIKLSRFFDILELNNLQTTNQTAGAFYHEDSINGGQNILLLTSRNQKLEDEFIKLENPSDSEVIKYVHAIDKEKIIYQTNYKIAVFDRTSEQHSLRESKVDTKRRRYQLMLNTQSLYLPSAEAPGMTSELLRVTDEGNFLSDRRYRTFAINGCEEFGNVHNFENDFIGYLCPSTQKILLLKIR